MCLSLREENEGIKEKRVRGARVTICSRSSSPFLFLFFIIVVVRVVRVLASSDKKLWWTRNCIQLHAVCKTGSGLPVTSYAVTPREKSLPRLAALASVYSMSTSCESAHQTFWNVQGQCLIMGKYVRALLDAGDVVDFSIFGSQIISIRIFKKFYRLKKNMLSFEGCLIFVWLIKNSARL